MMVHQRRHSKTEHDEVIVNVLNRLGSSSRHKRRRPRWQRWTMMLLLVLLGLCFLDLMYLQYKMLTFPDPCVVASQVKLELESHPRMPHKLLPMQFPKIIHQQWKTNEIPAGEFMEYHQAWKRLFPEPEYTHMLWTDENARELIATHYPWFLSSYDNYYMNIQRADSVRYFIMHFYGGLYADLDYEPIVNFWSAIPKDRVSLIESPYKVNEQVQNSLMASPKGDPFWNITFKVLYERRESHKVLSSTGPSLVDAVIERCPNPSWYHFLPCENFHRIPTGEAGANAPYISRIARAFLAYTPLSKTCGDWRNRDNCQYGIHHNSVSYLTTKDLLSIVN